jgi:hypothetical protein
MATRVTCEPVLFLYMLGIYLLFGVIQSLIYGRVCLEQAVAEPQDVARPTLTDVKENQTIGSVDCANLTGSTLEKVQAETSHWIRLSTMCMVLPSIVVDCYMGSWSDIFGRKVTLTLPVVG